MAVRREKVLLELEDHFSTPMVKAAAAAALLDKNLNDLDGSSTDVGKSTEKATKSTKEYSLAAAIADEKAARLKKTLRDQARASLDAEEGIGGLRRETDGLTRSAGRADTSINQLTGRLRLAADAAAVFGPSLVPVGAVGAPVLSGLASQLGFAAIGAGSLVLALGGVGDAMKAVEKAKLDPTVKNLEKAEKALAKVGPDAEVFVARMRDMRSVVADLRMSAAGGWLPGLTESFDSLEAVAPRVAAILERVGAAGGQLVAEGAEAFAGPEWGQFIAFVEVNAPQALDELGRTVGNVIKGLSELWMAFDPLNDDFSTALLNASRDFAEWSANLSDTEGFQEFVEYIRTNGPRVADTLVAVGNAVLQIIQALAPLGGPSLKIIETFANAIATIADSDMGTPILAAVAALSIYNRTLAVTAALQAKTMTGGGKGATLAAIAPVALGGAVANQAAVEAGSGHEIFGVNALQASPHNALQALATWDPDKWIFSDTIKSILTGGDKAEPAEEMTSTLTRGTGLTAAFTTVARKAEAAQLGLSDATSQTALSLGLSNAQMARSLDLIDQRTTAALGAFGAETRWRQALKDAREQADKNNKGIEGSSKAALDNRAALEQLAGAWGVQRDAMVANNESADAVEAKYRVARKAFVDTAVAMGVPIKEARKLARELNLIPESVATEIVADTDKATTAIDRIIAQMKSIPRRIRTDFYVNQLNAIDKPRGPELADGGTVNGPRAPYRDSVLAMLAPGEEVITNRNGEADQFRADRAAGRIPAYANGGTIQSVRVPSQMGSGGLSSTDIDRLASVLSKLRPVFGDQYIQPHNYSEFRREQDNARRAASAGGF